MSNYLQRHPPIFDDFLPTAKQAVNESRSHYARRFATRTWMLKYVIGVTLVIFNWLCITYETFMS